MSVTFKEVISNIKNLRQGGRQSQDSLLSDEQYGFIIDYHRANLIRQEYNKRKRVSPQEEQTLKIKFTRARDLEGDIFADMRVYGTKLPNVIITDYRPLYQGVRQTLLSRSFDRSSSTRIRNDVKDSFSGRVKRYFPLDETLYVVTPEPLQELYVTGIFERPIKVLELEGKLDPFDPYNFNYPISTTKLDTIYKMVVDGEFRLSSIMPNDMRADGNEQPSNNSPSTRKTKDKEDES